MLTQQQIKEILQDNEYLTNQNSNYQSYCQELADFCLPRKAWINSIRIQGDRVKFNFLYDSTAILSLRETAAGFNTYLTNPTSRWFGIQYRKAELMKRSSVRMFCKEVEDWSFSKLIQSNFYNVIPEWYTDTTGFGTGTFLMLKDEKEFVNFNSIPVNQVNRVVDANGNLIGLYRNFRLSARQAFKMWGSNVGESVLKALETKPFEDFEFLHYVGERFDRDVSKEDSSNMPFQSCWIGKKDKNVVAESGFMEMPYFSEVFYKDSNDPNGFAPTMDVLPWIKLINAMARTVIRGAMKQADPPYVMPSKGFVLPLNLNPAGMNYRDPKTSHDDLQPLNVGTGRIDIGVELMQMVQQKIERGMFVDLFRSFNEITKQMTVLETQQRISQSMALLGPTVNRFNRTLGMMVIRLISMGARDPFSGFPEVPEELQDEHYDLIYLSPLAKAQRQSEIVEIQSFLQDVGSIGQVIPSVFDNIDEDKYVNVLHRIRGITPEILREDKEIERMRQHREEQNQIIQSMQAGGAAAQIAKTGAEAHRATAQAEAASK